MHYVLQAHHKNNAELHSSVKEKNCFAVIVFMINGFDVFKCNIQCTHTHTLAHVIIFI